MCIYAFSVPSVLLFTAQERAELRVPLEHDSGVRGDFCAAKL